VAPHRRDPRAPPIHSPGSGRAARPAAVADALATAGAPLDEAALAGAFTTRGRWRERLPTILDALVAIGRARRDGAGRYSAV
jgi:hypothetical protein